MKNKASVPDNKKNPHNNTSNSNGGSSRLFKVYHNNEPYTSKFDFYVNMLTSVYIGIAVMFFLCWSLNSIYSKELFASNDSDKMGALAEKIVFSTTLLSAVAYLYKIFSGMLALCTGPNMQGEPKAVQQLPPSKSRNDNAQDKIEEGRAKTTTPSL